MSLDGILIHPQSVHAQKADMGKTKTVLETAIADFPCARPAHSMASMIAV